MCRGECEGVMMMVMVKVKVRGHGDQMRSEFWGEGECEGVSASVEGCG